MPFTQEIALELVLALCDQMERCPACFGVGKIRQSGDYQTHFCLVCEEAAKALYRLDSGGWWNPQYRMLVPLKLDDPKLYNEYKQLLDRVAQEAQKFAKRCPVCYGIKQIWAGDNKRQCLVCVRLHHAVQVYLESVELPIQRFV